MITLKEFNILLHHLHQASEIFGTEATIEEMKSKTLELVPIKDNRTHYAPRSVILHQKADRVHALENDLLKACDTYTLSINEETIFTARELIVESAYPWIHRKEPPLVYMEELMSDETFEPLLHDLYIKEKEILTSPVSVLNLPMHLEEKINNAFWKKTNTTLGESIPCTVEYMKSLHQHELKTIVKDEEDQNYAMKLITFRLYILGIL